MSDFLLNLARRSAGVPLATPRPASPAVGARSGTIAVEDTVPEVGAVSAEEEADATSPVPVVRPAAPFSDAAEPAPAERVRRQQPIPEAQVTRPPSTGRLDPPDPPSTSFEPLRSAQPEWVPPNEPLVPPLRTAAERASFPNSSEAARGEPIRPQIQPVACMAEPEEDPPQRTATTVPPVMLAALRPRPETQQPIVQDPSADPMPPPASRPPTPRIEVRIGRIDVEIASPSAAAASVPASQPLAAPARERPRGFDAYARLRAYGER